MENANSNKRTKPANATGVAQIPTPPKTQDTNRTHEPARQGTWLVGGHQEAPRNMTVVTREMPRTNKDELCQGDVVRG